MSGVVVRADGVVDAPEPPAAGGPHRATWRDWRVWSLVAAGLALVALVAGAVALVDTPPATRRGALVWVGDALLEVQPGSNTAETVTTAKALGFVPSGVANSRGGAALSDRARDRVWQLKSSSGGVVSFAGDGEAGGRGDGRSATSAHLRDPRGLVAGNTGTLIADRGNNRVREVGRNGRIRTVAGNGRTGNSGDGGPAVWAALEAPTGLAVTQSGEVLVVSDRANTVRRFWPDGAIRTVAGSGIAGYSGDGGPAVEAHLSSPTAVAATDDGTVFIADTGNERLRAVDPDGRIRTVAYWPDQAPVGMASFSDSVLVARADGSLVRVDANGAVTPIPRR